MSSPHLVVGLANPGEEYARTRHNAGAMVVDTLAERLGERLTRHKARARAVQTRVAGVPCVLAVPSSYMNVSGPPVRALASFYSVEPERLVVVHDDLDLPLGALRLKAGGGDGGHNGLRSVRASMGTGDWLRVRVGIDRPPGRQDPADYVLRPFSSTQREELAVVLQEAADAVETLLASGLEAAQNAHHAR